MEVTKDAFARGAKAVARYALWLLVAPLAGGVVMKLTLAITGDGTVRILVAGTLGAAVMCLVIWFSRVGGWNSAEEG